MSDAPFVIVGLGNPGRQYAHNRHNIGYMVADLLAERVGDSFKRHSRAPKAEVAEGRIRPGGPKLVLVKPLTFMNLSGSPVSALASFYKVPLEQVIVVHDELDLPYTSIKVKTGGGEGGHNGLRSISQVFGSKNYVRVRFGIGRPSGRQDPADFVLSDFSAVERKDLAYFVDRTADVVEAIVDNGVDWAQNAYHPA
ncbi:MAG: aminoacyl-tRNA hydrolase [Longispora sp.]|nr:aminoacyl-tRNA hydrolase [Longispora sp. (in: high G+C Gram-positive bacteria)]